MQASAQTITRHWAMPSPDTFSIAPIAALLDRWLLPSDIVVDPFARNSRRSKDFSNDLNPTTDARYHMDAVAFCDYMLGLGLEADAVLFDPPYSPRQIAEVYQAVGRQVTAADTQNARLYREVRNRLTRLLRVGGVAVSCGWNSAGFGKERGFLAEEILIVAHGGAHNDTIVTVERKVVEQGALPLDVAG